MALSIDERNVLEEMEKALKEGMGEEDLMMGLGMALERGLNADGTLNEFGVAVVALYKNIYPDLSDKFDEVIRTGGR